MTSSPKPAAAAREELPPALASMWRLCKLGYLHEPRLMLAAFGLSQLAALPDALLALWLMLPGAAVPLLALSAPAPVSETILPLAAIAMLGSTPVVVMLPAMMMLPPELNHVGSPDMQRLPRIKFGVEAIKWLLPATVFNVPVTVPMLPSTSPVPAFSPAGIRGRAPSLASTLPAPTPGAGPRCAHG